MDIQKKILGEYEFDSIIITLNKGEKAHLLTFEKKLYENMVIKTKYNIGDEVWGIVLDEIWNGKIAAIEIYYSFGIERIEYKVFVEEEMHFMFKEEYICPTKEELLKSL